MHNYIRKNPLFVIRGNWALQSKQLQENNSQLTDSDLNFQTGHETELIKRLAWRLNKSKDVIVAMLKKGAV